MSRKAEGVGFSLRLKLLIFGALLAVVPVVAVGLGLMNVNETTIKTENRAFRLVIAEDVADVLESVLRAAQDNLVGVQQILTNPNIPGEDRIEVARALVESSSHLETVAIYAKSGEYIAQIDQTQQGFEPAALPTARVRELSAINQSFDNLQVDADGRASIELTMAMRPNADKITGFLRTRINLELAQARTLSMAEHRLSSGARIVVLDAQRKVALSSEPALIGQQLDAEGMQASIDTVIREGVAFSGEHPTRPVLVSARPMGLLPWVVQVEVPTAVAYASLHRMRLIVLGGTLAAALVAMLLAVLMAARLTRPLDKLVAFTRKLGAGKFDERVDIDTRDEIALVARSMNGAAQELKENQERIAHEIAIRADLGRYLPEELVNSVVRREQTMELGGTRQPITVLFADVVRFTPLCENHPPEVIVEVLNGLFTLITTVIFEFGGTVDKFIGDCVMAFWGAPRQDVDQVHHALRAAEKITRLLEFANRYWMQQYGIEVKLAMGVHTGEAVVGNVGSTTRMEYTAIGRTVNFAARLEALAHENQTLVTEQVKAAGGAHFDFRRASTEVLAVGMEEMQVYEVLF